MASKFSEFLQTHKIDVRRLVIASQRSEKLQPEDRAVKLRKRLAKSKEGGAVAEGESKKPRSGRPVTVQLLRKATEGKPVTGAAKTRLLRAVNLILEQKKQATVDLRKLF